MTEVQAKLETARRCMPKGCGALRLRGTDWFAWAAAGASNTVLLASETGIAEILITRKSAFILTNSIEAERLGLEELPEGFKVFAPDWPDRAAVEKFVRASAASRQILSDRPAPGEHALPQTLFRAKRKLLPQEIRRYRALGRDAATAISRALAAAEPDWSENRLAAEGAKELLARGIHPALILAGGESRVEKYRHPTPTDARLGGRAMLVFCARRHGLYANLTRFVYFRKPTAGERKNLEAAAKAEAAAFAASKPGASLGGIFSAVSKAYAENGFPGQELRHHQGGTTGYLSREEVASPGCRSRLEAGNALAWNPSTPGAKIEDTVLLRDSGLEILTAEPSWPLIEVAGRPRPAIWIRKS